MMSVLIEIAFTSGRSLTIKQIFAKGPVSFLRTLFFLLLAFAVMALDYHSKTFHALRNQMGVVASPIEFSVNEPIKLINWLGISVATQHKLVAENAQLRAHELLLESKLQKLLTLERENAQLRELLKSSSEITGKVEVAGILAVDLNPGVHQIVIDKGSRNRVYVGQPVLDAYGVMGQVVDVGPLTSKILLVTDARSAIPVEDSRNGVQTIAVGLGVPDKLSLINVPKTSDIKVGDLFMASGLGLRYPVGYPVGVVSAVYNIPGQRFAYIILAPSAHLNRALQVLLAWPSQASLYKAVQGMLEKPLPQTS